MQTRIPVVLPVAVAAVAVALFAASLISGPVPPRPAAWEVVPVMEGELAPVPREDVRLDPGMRLEGHAQVVARSAPLPAELDLALEADLGEQGTLHAFFRARGLRDRTAASGLALFLDRTGGVASGLYRVRGEDLEPVRCDPASLPEVPRRVGVEVRARREAVEVSLDGAVVQRCRAPAVRGAEVGFRAGLSPVSVASIHARDSAGAVVFADRPEGRSGPAARLLAVAGGLALLAVLWLADGLLTGLALGSPRWLPRRTSAWSYLWLALLPLLSLADLEGLAQGLRLGRTPALAIPLVLALAPLVLARLAAVFATAPAFRPATSSLPLGALLRTRAGYWLAGATAIHAVVLALLAATSPPGVAGLVEIGLPLAADALLTALALVALPLAALAAGRGLLPGGGEALCRVGVVILAPSAAAGIAGFIAGGWNTSLHLAATAATAVLVGALLLQVHGRVVRGYNAASLAAVAALLLLAECAARQTYLDAGWDPVPEERFREHPVLGWVRASREFDHILDVQEPTTYPSEGFPVAFEAARSPGTTRIVCLGSSSTGGAYQMDDLDAFYPARLEERLEAWDPGRFEVLNQGVGGWNSLLVALYFRHFAEALQADVVTVYLGGNDMNTLGPRTYRQYWEAYQGAAGRAPGVRQLLNSSRLYVGFKGLVLSRAGGGAAVPAVPVEEARVNYAEILALARERGADVVLMSEAQRPSPAYMADYNAMLQEVAEAGGATYLDVAGALHRRAHEDLFLDQSHLTARGHEVVTELLYDHLLSEGLLDQELVREPGTAR